jgi:predicted MFS family arabinose efflux permease
MASQALIVVLAPTIVAIGADLGASVSAVGQARSIAAGTAIAASAAIARRIDRTAIPRLILVGGALAIVGCGMVAAAPYLAVFLLAHVLVGIALACLLSAGFAGVSAFGQDRRAWAIGWVAGANALAWIVVTPVVGIVVDRISWRAAQAVPAAIAALAMLAAPIAASAPSRSETVGLRTLFSQRSARRWIGAELAAYAAWTALLTFVGAFFIERLGVREAAVGWLLAAGAAAHFVAATRGGRIRAAMPRRRLVAALSLAMAALFLVELNAARSAPFAVAVFCMLGLAAGLRAPLSSGLGLDQLPEHPGAMMAARTGVTQLGYLLGSLIGGAVLAGSGFGTLGIVLAAGMATSAWLILRVADPMEAAGERRLEREKRGQTRLVESHACDSPLTG